MSTCENCAKQKILKILKKYQNKPNEAIHCLQEVQGCFGYIPEEWLGEISKYLNVPESDLYGIITFYALFRLTPKAKYSIDVCMGTACFIQGADGLVEELERTLNIKMGESTKDGKFALTNTRCVGCCGMAPVVTVNGEVHGKVKRDQIKGILEVLK